MSEIKLTTLSAISALAVLVVAGEGEAAPVNRQAPVSLFNGVEDIVIQCTRASTFAATRDCPKLQSDQRDWQSKPLAAVAHTAKVQWRMDLGSQICVDARTLIVLHK